MVERMTRAEDDWEWHRWRRHLYATMLTIAFAGGALFGLIAANFGLPGVWWAPAIIVVSAAFHGLMWRRRP